MDGMGKRGWRGVGYYVGQALRVGKLKMITRRRESGLRWEKCRRMGMGIVRWLGVYHISDSSQEQNMQHIWLSGRLSRENSLHVLYFLEQALSLSLPM